MDVADTARERKLIDDLTLKLKTAEAALHQRTEELAVINTVQQGLRAALDMESIFMLVGERIQELFDAQAVVIRSFNQEADTETIEFCVEKGERYYPGTR